MKREIVLLVVLVTCSRPKVPNQACDLPTGLFHQRGALTTQLNAAIRRGDRSRQDELQTQIKGVDEKYYQFMQEASQSFEKGGDSACCPENATDPVGRLVCRWAQYRTQRISAQQFIELFPVSPSDRQALWMLDRIANVRQTTEGVPRMFGTEGPVSSYITALFMLVKGDNLPALKKYMGLYIAADGQYAELMEDQLEHLFLERPDVVIRNWSFIKTNRRALQDLRDSLSDEQKRKIISGTKKYCPADAEQCRELGAALTAKPRTDR